MLLKLLGLGIPDSEWHKTEPWVRIGMRSTVWLMGGLVLFAAIFSIAGAVVASGTVTVDGYYKTVQHLDGGIVAKILVRDGDIVQPDAVLMRLDDTGTAANLAIVNGRIRDQLVQQARLFAERDRKPDFQIPDSVQPFHMEPQTQEIIKTQKALFAARRASHKGELSVLEQRLDQLKAMMAGQETDLKSRRRQLALATKELDAVEPLFKKGFANQSRLGQLQREQARLEGDVGRTIAEIERTKGAIAEAGLKIAQSEKDYTQNVVDELRKVQAQFAELEEQKKTLADKQQRTVIRAPIAGRVHALSAHTEGGVVQAGTPIMQIIPFDKKLVVEAQVPPQSIDKVRQGLTATVRFPAFNAQTTPTLSGTVVTVSPAEITDRAGKTYFTARIELTAAELERLGKGHKLLPGMPAEVFIETTSRSILSYFLKPLADTMAHAFRD